MDIKSKEARSYNMSRIRSTDTSPEVTLRKYLFSRGLRYRKNVRSLPGTPDLVFPKYRTVVFVHGCFWHRHPGCRYATTPATNTEFWNQKFQDNIERDRKVVSELSDLGWNIITVWECFVPSSEDGDLRTGLRRNHREPPLNRISFY